MSRFLNAYTALTPASSRSDVAQVLQSITNGTPHLTSPARILTHPPTALPLQIDDAKRAELIQTIIDDLTKSNGSSSKKSRLTSRGASPAAFRVPRTRKPPDRIPAYPDAAPALQAVKSLGKNPAGSEVIASSANLAALLSLSRTYKDELDASNEALRCVANAMLLVDNARTRFVEKQVNGGDFALELLEKSSNPERIFLASRLLFLSTVSILDAADFIRSLIDAKPPGHPANITEIIGVKLDVLTKGILTGVQFARQAMTDLLKFTFNLLLHYPKLVDDSNNKNEVKVMGDCWSDRLDGILPYLLRTFNSLPPSYPAPLVAPMTHVIHSLITIPVSPSLHNVWFPPTTSNRGSPVPPTKPGGLSESSGKGSRPSSNGSSQAGSPTGGPAKDPKPGAFDRAWSALAAGRRSLSRSSSPHASGEPVDVLLRSYDLLDVSLSHYMPGAADADEPDVRERCRAETDQTLDDVLTPLAVLLTKLCLADEGSRLRMRAWILPDDLDRSAPLEGRADLLGRLLRLLASVHHAKLKNAVGEMLFAICDSDAGTLASYVGYGNVAGFLFNKGIMSAPPPPGGGAAGPAATPAGVPINPITGVAERPSAPVEMSDEEKEREAEKLFVLFDRLEKSGAMPKESNPIRKAIQEGKLG
ncbi:guanine nucleotide exchange factor [Trametes elegans]|nr:guanine nucleotide exchange factor [Trametes elegans]